MDPNSNPPNPTPANPPFPPTRPSVVQGPEYKVDSHNEIEETKKVSRKMVFIISFILALLIPASIFAYTQYQKNSYKSISVAPTPIATAKPTPTPNPTADWIVYTSPDNKFSFKYPSSLIISDRSVQFPPVNIAISENASNEASSTILIEGTSTSNSIQDEITQSNGNLTFMGDQILGTNTYNLVETRPGQSAKTQKYLITNGNLMLSFTNTNNFDKKIFAQILSTFKFTSPQASSSPAATSSGNQIACTQEAKLCPDGVTYVSRQGPNCEFDACPIPN